MSHTPKASPTLIGPGPDWEATAYLSFPRDQWVAYIFGYKRAAEIL